MQQIMLDRHLLTMQVAADLAAAAVQCICLVCAAAHRVGAKFVTVGTATLLYCSVKIVDGFTNRRCWTVNADSSHTSSESIDKRHATALH